MSWWHSGVNLSPAVAEVKLMAVVCRLFRRGQTWNTGPYSDLMDLVGCSGERCSDSKPGQKWQNKGTNTIHTNIHKS